MKKAVLLFATITLCAGCEQVQIRPSAPLLWLSDSALERELLHVPEELPELQERKRQLPAIHATFARRTYPQRARRLALLCYQKTLGTDFMPIDMAEIALAETGGHRLSGRAVSHKGALGVWQLMPQRARSHGFAPEEMNDDEKCAEAAVRELATKLEMAGGNLRRAKRLYCGTGPDARLYEERRRHYRREILGELHRGLSRAAWEPLLLEGQRS